MIFTRILFQLLPAIFMTYIYFKIYKTINNSERLVSSFKSTETLDNSRVASRIASPKHLKIDMKNPKNEVNKSKTQLLDEKRSKRHTLNVLNTVKRALSVNSSRSVSKNFDSDSDSLTPVTPLESPNPMKPRRESNIEMMSRILVRFQYFMNPSNTFIIFYFKLFKNLSYSK